MIPRSLPAWEGSDFPITTRSFLGANFEHVLVGAMSEPNLVPNFVLECDLIEDQAVGAGREFVELPPEQARFARNSLEDVSTMIEDRASSRQHETHHHPVVL